MRPLFVSSFVLLAGCAVAPESDPVFTTSTATQVTPAKIAAWDDAAGWGNHADAGYLTQAEFAATPAASINTSQLASWDTAFGWGNHAAAGYVTQDALAQLPFGGISAAQISAWNDAASGAGASIAASDISAWNGTASQVQALSSVVQSMPAISSTDVSSWNAAASGVNALANAPAAGITAGQIGNWNTAYGWGNHASAGYQTTSAFSATPAGSITNTQLGNWNTAYGWGNHASAGYQTTSAFSASPAGSITSTQLGNWNTAYGWGNHATAGYQTTSAFNASPAGGITTTLIGNWNAAYARTESDPKVGTLSTDALPRWNGSALSDSVIVQKNGNIGVGTTSPQAPLSVGSTIHLGKGIATNTSKSCGITGFEWTNTPPSGGACNTYCTGQGFAAGVVSAQGSKSCGGAQCSYIADFATCAVGIHFNTGCDTCASSFVCTCLTPGAVFDAEVKLNAYLTVASTTGAPPAADCDAASERGRMKLDPATNTLWVCAASGWVAK